MWSFYFKYFQICAGFAIAKNCIVTSSHCLINKRGQAIINKLDPLAGFHVLMSSVYRGQGDLIRVRKMVRHEEDKPYDEGCDRGDISLIITEDPIDSSKWIDL